MQNANANTLQKLNEAVQNATYMNEYQDALMKIIEYYGLSEACPRKGGKHTAKKYGGAADDDEGRFEAIIKCIKQRSMRRSNKIAPSTPGNAAIQRLKNLASTPNGPILHIFKYLDIPDIYSIINPKDEGIFNEDALNTLIDKIKTSEQGIKWVPFTGYTDPYVNRSVNILLYNALDSNKPYGTHNIVISTISGQFTGGKANTAVYFDCPLLNNSPYPHSRIPTYNPTEILYYISKYRLTNVEVFYDAYVIGQSFVKLKAHKNKKITSLIDAFFQNMYKDKEVFERAEKFKNDADNMETIAKKHYQNLQQRIQNLDELGKKSVILTPVESISATNVQVEIQNSEETLILPAKQYIYTEYIRQPNLDKLFNTFGKELGNELAILLIQMPKQIDKNESVNVLCKAFEDDEDAKTKLQNDGRFDLVTQDTINMFTRDNEIDKRITLPITKNQAGGAGKRLNTYEAMTVKDLQLRASKRKIKGYSTMRKSELIAALRNKQRQKAL